MKLRKGKRLRHELGLDGIYFYKHAGQNRPMSSM